MMELFLELHDHYGAVYQKFRFKFDNEATLDQLKKKIESRCFIDSEVQELFLEDGREFDGLGETSLQFFGLKHGGKVTCRHKMLVNWVTYISMIDEIKKLTTSGVTAERRKIALDARNLLSQLSSSKFFAAYPSFAIEKLNISKTLNFLIHNTKKYIDRSVSAYFEALYPKHKVILKDKPKHFPGIHLRVFVFVDNDATFYAKTAGSVPVPEEEFDFINCPKIDLIEIFVYLLLKLIGLGPVEVHIIPDINKSDLIFIATKLINGFRTAFGVSAAESASSEVIEVSINPEMKTQMKILSLLLCLNDLQRNKGNHGVAEHQPSELEMNQVQHSSTRELRIVDFGINLALIDYEPSNLNSYFDMASLNTYFAKWDILNNIYKAREEMNNLPALKNNNNVNQKRFDRYFERLEKALTEFFNN